ncbi:hypothetical protein B0H19DRAFT_1173322 [Mycena capillaripes]|nr:hypothetical protein B0H19DRAFT_1173322 [Mycena capillaripes]
MHSHPQMPSQQTSAQTATLGGWDISISVVLFLQGVLCGQFAYYTNVNKRDSVWLKLFVAGLALLTTLKTIQVLAVMWIQNVTLFHNPEAASSLWETYWVPKLSPIFESVAAVYVQSFFCRRLWKISHNAYIVVVCMTSFTLALVSGGVTVWFIVPHLGAVLCGDLLLTGSTVFYLLLSPSSDNTSKCPRQNVLLIINSKCQSAAPGALCALINFVSAVVSAVLVHTQPGNTSFSSMISSVSNTVLPQLYVWAAMWTLNSREDIHLADNNQCTLHPELRSTSDSGTSGHPVAPAGGGNKLIDLQRSQDRLLSLGATEKIQQDLQPDGVCRLV